MSKHVLVAFQERSSLGLSVQVGGCDKLHLAYQLGERLRAEEVHVDQLGFLARSL